MTTVAAPFLTWHSHGGLAFIRGKWRCSSCGHRLWINGIAPVESRKLPPHTWPLELIDRYRAKRL